MCIPAGCQWERPSHEEEEGLEALDLQGGEGGQVHCRQVWRGRCPGRGARFQICLSLALPFYLWSPERSRLAATFLVHSMLPHQASSRREMVGLLSWVCWSWGEDATRL